MALHDCLTILLICNHIDAEEIACFFTLIVFLVSCDWLCYMFFLTVLCDCNIS